MPAIEKWGPPTWTLFHVVAAKVNDESVVEPLVAHIRNLCSHLPCRECSKHATDFWKRVPRPTNKQELVDVLYNFHNNVNRNKKKPSYEYEKVVEYSKISLIDSFNKFVNVYHTKGDMNQMTETFQRGIAVVQFRKFIIANITKFS
jgi:hypothetical protein